MSRKVFTAGEVLAAADVNSFLMDQTVMSFAGTAARGSAIPSPVEGMYTHLEDTDRLEFWNGSAWATPFGLTLVAQQAVAGVGTITLSNVFSAAYDDYKVIYSGGSRTSGADYIGVRLGLNGTPATGSNYDTGFVTVNFSTSGVAGAAGTTNSFQYAGRADTNYADLSLEIRSPFLAKHTRIAGTFVLDGGQGVTTSGVHELANSYNDLIVIALGSGTFTGGTISVYGYKKA
jgi:hypothetical protein